MQRLALSVAAVVALAVFLARTVQLSAQGGGFNRPCDANVLCSPFDPDRWVAPYTTDWAWRATWADGAVALGAGVGAFLLICVVLLAWRQLEGTDRLQPGAARTNNVALGEAPQTRDEATPNRSDSPPRELAIDESSRSATEASELPRKQRRGETPTVYGEDHAPWIVRNWWAPTGAAIGFLYAAASSGAFGPPSAYSPADIPPGAIPIGVGTAWVVDRVIVKPMRRGRPRD